MTKKDESGRYFQVCYVTPQRHNFEIHICGFDFDVVNMEDDSFFLEDRFSNIDRDLKNKKIMVPMNPEGGARTAPRASRLGRRQC